MHGFWRVSNLADDIREYGGIDDSNDIEDVDSSMPPNLRCLFRKYNWCIHKIGGTSHTKLKLLADLSSLLQQAQELASCVCLLSLSLTLWESTMLEHRPFPQYSQGHIDCKYMHWLQATESAYTVHALPYTCAYTYTMYTIYMARKVDRVLNFTIGGFFWNRQTIN